LKNSNIPQSKPKGGALWQIFSSNKSAQANRKKGFYTNRNPNKQEVGFIFVGVVNDKREGEDGLDHGIKKF
jgi:hypothetical protein